jgi:hypothetical protein
VGERAPKMNANDLPRWMLSPCHRAVPRTIERCKD